MPDDVQAGGAAPTLLWHVGPFRCFLTPPHADPPYVVVVHRGDEPLLSERFPDHNGATQFAVDSLRRFAHGVTALE